LRALAITGKQRWSELPGVPTIEEAGVKGFDLDTWYGLWFPAATPAEYVSRMHAEAAKAAQDPAAKSLFEKYGLRGVGSSPAELDRALREALTVMKKLTAYMGIVPQ
jgi:tripartite-type tricarboxylate transporter receptor subunit TctC